MGEGRGEVPLHGELVTARIEIEGVGLVQQRPGRRLFVFGSVGGDPVEVFVAGLADARLRRAMEDVTDSYLAARFGEDQRALGELEGRVRLVEDLKLDSV